MRLQRGFSLVETLVAAAIAFVVGWLLIRLVGATASAASHLDARLNARSAADRLAERLTGDSVSAWSVFVPPADVLGASNADGHEIDFASEDSTHRSYWWAYRFDAAAQSVVAYAYGSSGAPVAGETFSGVTTFAAQTHALSDLKLASSDVYDALFAGATLVPADVSFAWNAQAVGGNHLVRVQIDGIGIQRTLVLASGTAPTHFTVIVNYTPAPPVPTP
ncbi:MAG TPA: type II secretion system protein [Candidatus Baltobacteraceae bacterium]|nr:type II secretion system protein [Candidatus Baltobacteraceae bacterium]